MPHFVLGGSDGAEKRREQLRGGAFVYESPRGLRLETALLIEALPRRAPGRALFGMDTEGAVALAARALWPEADLSWFHLDAYVAAKVSATLTRNGGDDVTVAAAEDLPDGPFGLVALPFPRGGERALHWDLLEAAHDALAPNGRLVAATDGAPDWLRKAVKKVFRNVTPAAPTGRKRGQGGCFYAERRREGSALSNRSHVTTPTIEVADAGTLELRIETRPGTFSHGRTDRGTRALAEGVDLESADSVLDLGCGCGTLGLQAALRLPTARVCLVDSNARAIGCARRNAERNGVADRVQAIVRADLEDIPQAGDGGYAVALANPPYFSGFRIARSFVTAAGACLRPGGRLHLVAKIGPSAENHAVLVDEVFGNCRATERHGYALLSATRPRC